MLESSSTVRIVVVSRASSSPAAAAEDTAKSLRSLGDSVELTVTDRPNRPEMLALLRESDLVVIDRPLDAESDALLETLRGLGGPPAVVVARDANEQVAVDAFRRGAAECVLVGDDYVDLLQVVALEQMRIWREERDRQRSERRISELQRYNENIIQNMNSALLVVDPLGIVTYGNPTAERILCPGRDALVGREIWDWFTRGSRDRALISRTLEEGVRFKGAETTVTRADHSIVPIGISCAPMVDDDGDRIGAVEIFQDLTEIKQLQQQVLQTEKMASIGQLAAGVAHEINNPMGFIHANLFQMSEYLVDLQRVFSKVEDLRKAIGDDAPEELVAARDALETVSRDVDLEYVLTDFVKAIRESQEGSERIRHIVRDLKDFSHQDDSERVPSDVNQCVDSTISIVWTMMKHSVVLQKSYSELPRVHCFPMQLKQVFMNLLVNAYQAIEERLGESGATGEIQVRTAHVRDGVVVTISDSGAGIATEHLGRIFDPFFTTKEVGAGTGLGLSTCYSIIQRHQGTIQVDSKVGDGTTFEVWLPIVPPEELPSGE